MRFVHNHLLVGKESINCKTVLKTAWAYPLNHVWQFALVKLSSTELFYITAKKLRPMQLHFCMSCRLLTQNASAWLMEDLYRNPGPIQFSGPGANLITMTLAVEDNDYIGKMQELCAYLDKVGVILWFENLLELQSLIALGKIECAQFSCIISSSIVSAAYSLPEKHILLSFDGEDLVSWSLYKHVKTEMLLLAGFLQVKEIVKPGCAGELLKAALCSMASITEILTVMSTPSYRGLTPFWLSWEHRDVRWSLIPERF